MTPLGGRCRVAAVCVAAAAAVSGCSITGQVTMNADDTATVDIVVTQDLQASGTPLCEDADQLTAYGMTGESLPADDGQVVCHVHGVTPPPSQVHWWPFPTGHDNGRLFLVLPVSGLTGTGSVNPLTDIDLTIAFPGPILDAVGATEVSWSTARWTDPERAFTKGIGAVALDHPGLPPAWTMALVGLGGLVVGAGGVLLALRGVRRKTKPDAAATAPALTGADADETPAEPALAPAPETPKPENPEVWATDD